MLSTPPQARAQAARTLARMRTYAKTIAGGAERAELLRALVRLPVARLASMNPIHAEHEVEEAILRMRGGSNDRPTTGVVCASRASALAMTQTRTVAARLAQRGIATTILTVTTAGDRAQDRALDQLGSSNVFVTELEVALREGRADYAVHSCKDLPSDLPADMVLVATSARVDPRDAFCSERYASFDALPAGAVVGTSSPRRRMQLAALRPDLVYRDVRGNVDTRLRKIRDGEYDAIVLAMAGLQRLHASATHTVAFDVDTVVPAVAQGALAIEMHAGARKHLAQELRAAVNDDYAERCVACERAALSALRAGCSAPIGIYARYAGDGVTMVVRAVACEWRARVVEERAVENLDEARAFGRDVAQLLKTSAQ